MNWIEFFFQTTSKSVRHLPKLRFAMKDGVIYLTDETGAAKAIACYSLRSAAWFGRMIEKLEVPEEVRSL